MNGPHPDSATPAGPPDWEALARYLAGEARGEELERVRGWLAANPEDHRLAEALDRLAGEVPVEAPAGLDVEAALRKTKAAAGLAPVLSLEQGRARRAMAAARPWWQSPVWQVAAVLGVVAIGATVLRRGSAADRPQLAAETVHRTAVGQVDSVSLSDGSRVILAPGSELAVSGTYGTGPREVRLTGQAWFDVVHDDARPFVVRTQGAEVRDVGTKFTVNDREASRVLVSVHEGAVLLRASAQPAESGVLLHQGDEATVEGGAVASTSRGTLAPDAASWVTGVLHFRDVSLAEVSRALQAWYGLEVRITDPSLREAKVTIDVNAGSLGSVGQELGLAVGGAVRVSGDTVVISRK